MERYIIGSFGHQIHNYITYKELESRLARVTQSIRRILFFFQSLKDRKNGICLENGVLVAGVGVFVFILFLPKPIVNNRVTYLNSIEIASQSLKFQAYDGDIAQDMIGFRALVSRQDPYPVLGTVFQKEIGLNWNLLIESTHPPTAFLFAAPVALFPWKIASGL